LTDYRRSHYYFAVRYDPRAIIFDLDGVLADSEGLHVQAWQRLFAVWRLPFEPRWALEWVGVPDVEIAALVAGRFPARIGTDELLNDKRYRFRELVGAGLKPFEGIAEELEQCLARSVPVAVGTSSARADATLMLQVMGFEAYFPIVVAGDDVPRVKPAPDIYLEAARLLDIPPMHCIALEDSPGGIIAARAAGMGVVAVATSFAPAWLGAADRVFAVPAEAIRWLRSIAVPGPAAS
jgi:HAD superfamily hydrolase (TIGR01509 family)